MNKLIIKQLKRLLEHLEYYNKFGPFYSYSTEYVDDVRNTLEKMEKENKVDYDEEPVVACGYCRSLHIETDEHENDVCLKCGATNELQEFKNIHEYLQFANNGRK